jgi:hypothetical protein
MLINVPPRTQEGCKGVVFPSISGAQEVPLLLSGCKSCSKKTDHGLPCHDIGANIPYGVKRHQNIPSNQYASANYLMELQSKLYLYNYIVNGIPRDTLYNLGFGTANNISNQLTYKILSVSGNRMSLRGRDPRIIKSPLSLTNTNWPDAAPDTMRPLDMSDAQWDIAKFGRLISSGIFSALPVGAAVAINIPSILYDKVEPFITKIIPPTFPVTDPDQADFDIELSADIGLAMTPFDSSFPPDAYFVDIFYYAIAPDAFANYQPPVEDWYSKNTLIINYEDFAAAEGIIDLPNRYGDQSRVLHPSLGSLIVRYKVGNDVFNHYISDDNVIYLQDSNSTSIDLSALLDVSNISEVKINYCPQASDKDNLWNYIDLEYNFVDFDNLGGVLILKDKDGNNTPIDRASIKIEYNIVGNPDLIEYLDFDYSYIVNESILDASGLLEIAYLDNIYINYRYRGNGWTIPFNKTCANDQIDYQGSYVHGIDEDDNKRRCTNTSCQKFKNGGYVAGNCWKTIDADKFVIGDEQGPKPIADAGDSRYLSRLWSRTSWIIDQGSPGSASHRNFAYARPSDGGPSIQELIGGYFNAVPGGFFSKKQSLFEAQFGQRRVWDDDGNFFQELIHGAFEARTYQIENDIIIDRGFIGAFSEKYIGWAGRTNYRGTMLQNNLPKYGTQSRGLYSCQSGENGMQMPKRLSADDQQLFSTGNNPDMIRPIENMKIQEIL